MARQNHTSLNIDAATTAALDSRRRASETRSARLGADIAAYHMLLDEGLRRARRVLTRPEASLILDVFNAAPDGQIWTADRMAHRIDDAIALDGMADKWGVDGPDLLAKIGAFGDLPAMALADWASSVWSKKTFDLAAETAIFRG